MSFHYVYRLDCEPKVVPTEEYEKHLQDGWYDSPAKFPSREDQKLAECDVDECEQEIKRGRGRPKKIPWD